MSSKKHKVIVGMSGGVDSSVTAWLLLQAGYQVEGVFMKNWEEDDADNHCSAELDFADAKAVCARLNIPITGINFAKKYWDNVFKHFLLEYRSGRTPNPDILCNKEIKFKAFLDYALAHGADYIATGHYVRCIQEDNNYVMLKGLDDNKDQSYFLYTLGQEQLEKCLFPIGELKKSDVRTIAKEQGFINHNKKDSTGICFIGERKFKQFLSEYILAQPGPIITPEGETIANHDGLMFYTLGQRQGLNIGGLSNKPELPWYVVAKDIENNVLIVGQGVDHPLLYSQQLICEDLHWIQTEEPALPLKCEAKIRYRQAQQTCVLEKREDTYHVSFNTKQRAITPGQSIVFYQNDICLGGGIIKE